MVLTTESHCTSFVYRFDYIVRDSRACGLGCNFQFERYVSISSGGLTLWQIHDNAHPSV